MRQRTVRQETTMAKHGTLPEFTYQRRCVTSDKPIMFALGQDDERLDNAEVDDEEIEDDFDSSSDEEVADEDGNGGDNFPLWCQCRSKGKISGISVTSGREKMYLGLKDLKTHRSL